MPKSPLSGFQEVVSRVKKYPSLNRGKPRDSINIRISAVREALKTDAPRKPVSTIVVFFIVDGTAESHVLTAK
jgi:hypothetical protein